MKKRRSIEITVFRRRTTVVLRSQTSRDDIVMQSAPDADPQLPDLSLPETKIPLLNGPISHRLIGLLKSRKRD